MWNTKHGRPIPGNTTKQTWKPIARQITYCPYCSKKYSTAILLLQHLSIRRGKYTWPTCIFPLQPENKTAKEIWEDIWQHDNNKTRYDKNKNRESNTGKRRPIRETNPTKRLKLTPNQPTGMPSKTSNKRTIRDTNSGQRTQNLPQQNLESRWASRARKSHTLWRHATSLLWWERGTRGSPTSKCNNQQGRKKPAWQRTIRASKWYKPENLPWTTTLWIPIRETRAPRI